MDRHLTRRGARNVSLDLEKLANLFQYQHEVLGIPLKVAMDFAWKCDVLSDAVERKAITNDPIHGIGKEAAPEFQQPAKNETGESVEPTGEQPSWDPNAIGDDRGGPYKSEADEAAYMAGNFDQREFHQLRDKEQAGDIPKVDPPSRTAADSLARLAKMCTAGSQEALRSMSDQLKSIVAKLDAAGGKGTATLVAGAKKQIDALDKLSDELIKLDATGEGNPELLLAADNVQQAVAEIMPHLEIVADSSADQSSPTAMLEHEQLLEDGTIGKLVGLAGTITDSAMKSLSKANKEAAKKSQDEDEDKGDDDKGDDDKGDDDKGDDDKGDDDKGDDDNGDDDKGDDEDDDEDDDKGNGKTAGYDLFSL